METSPRPASTVSTNLKEFSNNHITSKTDELATEEPLEIRVLRRDRDGGGSWVSFSIAVTMRTPGNDFELSAGFLFSEGVVKDKNQILQISYCKDPGVEQQFNIVSVFLSDDTLFDHQKLSRNVYTSSSCGICGKGSLELVKAVCETRPVGDIFVSTKMLRQLPDIVRKSQGVFARTGGLHASALFDQDGNLVLLREDVGRHNALDKLVGAAFFSGKLPASNTILLLSGRASFELVQKAVLAGIPAIASVGAPSSLAVDLAREYGLTLVGFLRNDRFNLYSGEERILNNE